MTQKERDRAILDAHFAALGGGTPLWEGLLLAVLVVGAAVLICCLSAK